MKMQELRGLNDQQLADTLRDTCDRLFRLRFQAATERLDAPSEMRKLRKDIARVKTLIREREIAASSAAAATT
jgi:large subunit ribosomal protein L29